jgi:hypothetical protein
MWGSLQSCAPIANLIANRRKRPGLPTRAQDGILPHTQNDPLPQLGWDNSEDWRHML